ncbi:uncharacterized protein LOC144179946 [Haemaphysalis longicornis]
MSSLKAANISHIVTTLASFTMIVGHFRLKQNFTAPVSLWTALSWTMTGFQRTCKKDTSLDVMGSGPLRYLGIKGTEVLCFEDSSTMIQKARRINFDYKIQSWAIFDIEFEDYRNACGEGAFHRIAALRRLQEQFL